MTKIEIILSIHFWHLFAALGLLKELSTSRPSSTGATRGRNSSGNLEKVESGGGSAHSFIPVANQDRTGINKPIKYCITSLATPENIRNHKSKPTTTNRLVVTLTSHLFTNFSTCTLSIARAKIRRINARVFIENRRQERPFILQREKRMARRMS